MVLPWHCRYSETATRALKSPDAGRVLEPERYHLCIIISSRFFDEATILFRVDF
jgi:hypothetical protein